MPYVGVITPFITVSVCKILNYNLYPSLPISSTLVFQICPEVWCLRYVFGDPNTFSRLVFGSLGPVIPWAWSCEGNPQQKTPDLARCFGVQTPFEKGFGWLRIHYKYLFTHIWYIYTYTWILDMHYIYISIDLSMIFGDSSIFHKISSLMWRWVVSWMVSYCFTHLHWHGNTKGEKVVNVRFHQKANKILFIW